MVTTSDYYQKNKEKINKQVKQYYQDHKEERLEYQRKHRKENRERLLIRTRDKRKTRLLFAIDLLGGKCVDCGGIFEPIVYDFHHQEPTLKEFTLSENMLVSEERFLAEINKCVLLCANCHRLRHRKEYYENK